ncbi:MAG: NAD(P)-dependent oxidoreductase [SAR202 cluster bacterium]|nr:NAD(P)-dependent oxidoreductase [SAR202 cluster bacterium]|tara:strand:+ start:833 stop:1702 length:870 start_codon:yes stop_codon:yes gene_type:complete
MTTVFVTGSSGRAGEYIIKDLLNNDYEVVGVDQKPPGDTEARRDLDYTFKKVDVTDFGQVLSAMKGCDAVIHMAAIPNPIMAPEHEVFRVNMTSTWNVLEAAEIIGIKKVVLASSVNAIGGVFSKGISPRPYFPVDEKHPTFSEDAYSIGKWVGEELADAFVRRRSGELQIASMRFHGLMSRERQSLMNSQAKRYGAYDTNAKHFWGWSDICESARACVLAIEVDFKGHEVFFINNEDTSADEPTEELIKQLYPESEIRSPMPGHQTAISIDKAKQILGWHPKGTWRDA